MSFGGTILENYHSQEEPLSTMIERLSERGAGGEDDFYYPFISAWKRKNEEKKRLECLTLWNGPSMETFDERTLQITALLRHE